MHWSLRLGGLLICVALGAELGARLDDWLFDRVPLLASPSSADLITQDQYGRHGRPFAHFQKWRLNRFGFRGPDMNLKPTSGCRRILILGASETFGLFESPDQEFPALLRQGNAACTEIVNAAVVGMGLGAMKSSWEHRLKYFDPDEVLVYPSPLFYLSDDTPAPNSHPGSATPAPPATAAFRSRFLGRLHGHLHVPDFIQVRRDQRAVEAQLAGSGPGIFPDVPQERLDAYQADLDALVAGILAAGRPVALLTHAVKFDERDAHLDEALAVWEMRVFTPRATGRVLIGFNSGANARLRAVAAKYQVPVIDVAAAVAGCQACFGDLVHFSDQGAQRVAATVRAALQSPPPERSPRAVQ